MDRRLRRFHCRARDGRVVRRQERDGLRVVRGQEGNWVLRWEDGRGGGGILRRQASPDAARRRVDPGLCAVGFERAGRRRVRCHGRIGPGFRRVRPARRGET
jgi:hypothetical protein